MKIEAKIFDAMDSINRINSKRDQGQRSQEPIPTTETKRWEVQNDPPATVLKFMNERREVELQVPSEVQLRVYREVQKFLNKDS